MAITMNGQTFRTLSDELYLNGQRIVAAHAGGTLVYPEGEEQMAKVSGGFSYSASHTHNGDTDESPVIGSVSNHLNCSYVGTFFTSAVEDTYTVTPGWFGWDVSDDDYYRISESPIMTQYWYRYSALYEITPPAPIGTNGTEVAVRRIPISPSYHIGAFAVDIDMSVPQFCQPVRVRNGDTFGKATCRYVTDFMSTVSGHYEVQRSDWFMYEGRRTAILKLGSNVGYGVERALICFDESNLRAFSIRFLVTVEQTINWEYKLSNGVVTPISSTSTKQYAYGFKGQERGESADFYMPITNIEILNGE